MRADHFLWTEERIDELKRRWDAGETCSAIGHTMGVSRNAIIGKVHRLGLNARGVKLSDEERFRRAEEQWARRKPREKRVREPKTVVLPVPEPAFIGSLDIPFANLRPWLSSGANQCRYIAAEPPGPDYLACGNETLPGESYCGHCSGIVFNRGQVASLVPEKVAA